MGAYENPNVNAGVDTKSGLIRAQGIQGFAEGIAKGVSAYGTAMAKQREQTAKTLKAAKISLAADTKTASDETKIAIDAVNADTTNNIESGPSMGTSIMINAKTDVVNALQTIRTNPGSPEAIKEGLYVEQTKQDYKLFADNMGDLDLVLEKWKTGKYSLSQSNPFLGQISQGTGITSTASWSKNKEGTGNNAIVTFESDTIAAMNTVLGVLGDKDALGSAALGRKYSVNLLKLGPPSSNPFIEGFPKAGLMGVLPYAIDKTIDDFIKKSPTSTTTITGTALKDYTKADVIKNYSNTYKDAAPLVLSAGVFANAEANVLLRQDLGHLPANAYYEELIKSGDIKQRKDGSMFMMVPGTVKDGKKVYHTTNEKLRNSQGLFNKQFVELDVPEIFMDPNGEDRVLAGNNFYTKEGYDGLVNVIKYRKLNAEQWTGASRKEISETKIEDSTVGSEIIDEIKAIDIYTPDQYESLKGLPTEQQAKDASFYTKENIRLHREYLKRKGINTSTREEIINDLNKYVGKGDRGDGTPYKQEDVDLFINKLGTFVLFDGDAKITEPKPFVSYDSSNNNSLIPIYAKQLGSQLKVESKEDLQKGNIQTNDLDVD